MTVVAATLATRLHAGQIDQHGTPHIDHLTAVVTILRERWPDAPEWAVEAAWLHDALEDTGATAEGLLAAGITRPAVQLVQALMRPAGLSHADWIVSLTMSDNLWALRVGLAVENYNSTLAYAVA